MEEFTSYYERNMELLREYRPDFTPRITGKVPDGVVVVKSKSGHVTITLDGSLIHSKYDPLKEGERFVTASGISSGDDVVCYGLGLGYHVEAILDAIGARGRCYVIELNRSLLASAFIFRDLSRLIKWDNLIMIHDEDEMAVAEKCMALLSDMGGGPDEPAAKIVIHAASFKFIPRKFETIQNALEVMLMERSVPQVFRRQSKDNLIRNVDEILSWPGIEQVFSGMRGSPAFLVSAGPSLDEAIPHLKKYQDRAWILCVDTAFAALLEASIRPDFVMVVDPQDASLDHFRGFLEAGVPLIFIPTASGAVIEAYRGPKIVAVQSGHSIVSKIEHLLADKGAVAAGGSTACISLGILVKYGLDPIILVGQDCGFPDMKVYSSNVLWTRRMLSTLNRFSTLEMKHRSVARSQKLVMVKDRFGQDVPTHQNLYSYLRELERIIEANPDIRFYNFFSKGAAIRGAKDLYFTEEVEGMLERKPDKSCEIRKQAFDERKKGVILRIISRGD